MKLSLSCRIAELSNDKEKSFLSIEKLIKMAVINGFTGISLRPSVVSTSTPKQSVLKVKDVFNLNNISVSMITSNINLATNNKYAANNLKNITPCLDLAEQLETSVVRIMIKHHDDIIFAKKALDEALERGIVLTQQTHWGTLAETIDETLALVKVIKRKNFGITYEPANLLACGSDHSLMGLEKLLPYIVNFYFQNICLDKNGSHEFKTLGKGNIKVKYLPLNDKKGIDIYPLINFLYKQKYDKWFTIHQPLREGQKVDEAIEEASNLFLAYKN